MPPTGSRPSRPLAFAWTVLLAASISSPRAPAAAISGLPGIRSVSPVPGARLVLPPTNVIVGLETATRLPATAFRSAIVVVGSVSGAHAGRLTLSGDGRSLLFQPEHGFAWGETVTVRLDGPLAPGLAAAEPRPAFSFDIARVPPPPPTLSLMSELASAGVTPAPGAAAPARAARAQDTLPPDFPAIAASVSLPSAPGPLFLATLTFPLTTTPYLLMLNDWAVPYFYRAMPATCWDFKQQPDGRYTYFDEQGWKFYALDPWSLAVVDSFACGNGYAADVHELRVLPNGHALLLSYDPEVVDMSGIVEGGDTAAVVTGLVVQEIDESKDVVFQWRSWDHFQITDCTHIDLTAHAIDCVHGNALELDTDGNLLLSSRHLDEVTKIDRQTGDVIWRWGGKMNQFCFLDDTLGFWRQHAIRRLDNGHYTLFDNGNYHDPPFSRAVEYELDQEAKTARLVWQYRATPDIFGGAMGYTQRLENGNTLISYGLGKPDILEVTPEGLEVMRMQLPPGMFSYRAYRFVTPTGVGVAPPAPTPLRSVVHPNPFRGRTELALDLAARADVSLGVFDVHGREVLRVAERLAAGPGRCRFGIDLSRRPPGLYFCRVTIGPRSETRRLLLLR